MPGQGGQPVERGRGFRWWWVLHDDTDVTPKNGVQKKILKITF